MATSSGVANFSPNRNQIILRALRQCNAIQSGEVGGAQEISDASDALNAMIAQWQATGLHLWAETEGILFLQPGQYSYGLGGTTADNSALDPTGWRQTATTANLSAGTTAIPVASTSGISSGDNFGVTLANNSIFWSTVSGAPSGGVVTLATGLSSAANSGTACFDYTTKLVRPLRIVGMRRFYIASAQETPMTAFSRLDYRDMPNKTSQGTVTNYFYDPQLNTGVVWVWPAPPDSLSACKFTFMRPIYDFTSAADLPDFPQEWMNALTWNLALELAPEYGVGPNRYSYIEKMAAKTLDLVEGFDREPESLAFGLSFDGPMQDH